MENCKLNQSPRPSAGFTLIEVLVALMILAIALTALIRATTESIDDMIRLQNKTIATQIAANLISQTQLGLLQVPYAPYHTDGDSQMVNQHWHWSLSRETTTTHNVDEIIAKVTSEPLHRSEVALYGTAVKK